MGRRVEGPASSARARQGGGPQRGCPASPGARQGLGLGGRSTPRSGPTAGGRGRGARRARCPERSGARPHQSAAHTQWAERPPRTSPLRAPGARARRHPHPHPAPGVRGPSRPRPPPRGLTLPGKGPGRSSFSACLFSSTRRALQFSHQTPRSEPGEEPPPLPEPGEPVPKPGEPPREPGELVPMPGEAGPGEPVKEPGDEVPEPGDGVPDEPSAEPAPSGVGRLPARDSSYAFRYQLSGEKGAAGLVGEQTSFTCGVDVQSQGPWGARAPAPPGPGRAPRPRAPDPPSPAAEGASVCPAHRPRRSGAPARLPRRRRTPPRVRRGGLARGLPAGPARGNPYSHPSREKPRFEILEDAMPRAEGGGASGFFIHLGCSPADPEGTWKELQAPGK